MRHCKPVSVKKACAVKDEFAPWTPVYMILCYWNHIRNQTGDKGACKTGFDGES